MAALETLIFDVDGTLAETERDGHRVAFNQAFAEAGLDWYWSVEQYGELLEVAGGKERIQHYLETCLQDNPITADPKGLIAELHAAKTQHYKQILEAGIIELRPGIRELIQIARSQDIRLAIATTSALENVLALLETALDPTSVDWFEVIVAGDMVPCKKPAPDVYQSVLQIMNLPPDACLAIEDSQQGLQSALATQLKTVITHNDYTTHHDFSGACLVVPYLEANSLEVILENSATSERE